ncbi:MAG: rhodanese-like domain-containing protein [Nitrospirota bacterium]
MSQKAAGLAVKWGYTNIRVFVQGEPGWKKAGYYTTSIPDFVKTGNIVLVDLRSTEAVKTGHIPGTVSIPAGILADARNKFPSYQGAHIVFYSDSTDDLKMAVKTARRWGYRKTTVFAGGVDSWKQKGYSLAKGLAASEINYTRRISPGEISITDFEKSMKSGTAVIVDVRTPTEHAAGHFKGAVNIPVDDIASRCAELSKEKTILTHCVTGVRAEMAFNILKEQGYAAKFLKAEPVFNPDGTYRIIE